MFSLILAVGVKIEILSLNRVVAGDIALLGRSQVGLNAF